MGFDIAPPDDMIDDKWYYCTVIAFEDPFAEGCFGDTMTWHCCHQGNWINDWAGNGQCTLVWPLCFMSPFGSQRLVNIQGPFDTAQECADFGA
ncbi:hypothetical protein ES703_105853 [subsurface metagenome]